MSLGKKFLAKAYTYTSLYLSTSKLQSSIVLAPLHYTSYPNTSTITLSTLELVFRG